MASIKKKWGNKGNDVLTVTYNGQNPLPQTESVSFSSTQNPGDTVRTLPVTFVSSDKSTRVQRNVVQYTKDNPPPTGDVYILHTNGSLYTTDEWNTAWNANAVGIAVLTDTKKFVIALEDSADMKKIFDNNTTYPDLPQISFIYRPTDEPILKKDLNGEYNTQKMTDVYGTDSTFAAGYCASYTFRNGKNGYLPSLGEWFIAYTNKEAVDAAMTKCGGAPFREKNYWSSTRIQNSIDGGLCHFSIINYTSGHIGSNFIKNVTQCTRPFCAL